VVIEATRRLVVEERLGAVATVIAGPDLGAKAVIDYDDGYVAGEMPQIIADDVLADARELAEHEQSRTLAYGDREVFIEAVAPQPQLLIFGSDEVAQPLTVMAHELGFRIVVSDPRPAFTTPARFPLAADVVVGWPDKVADQLTVDRRTYVVLLNHNARFETPALRIVVGSPARYIGAMGSRRTHAKRIAKLEEAGYTATDIERIHGPVGLDIGAETPAEMAVSILAEIIQARYGFGTGESLRGRDGRIHLQRPAGEGNEG
jgi:xanthine dehydrogenase accessory factor